MELREFIEARLADDQKIAEDAYALDENWPFWVDVDDEHHFQAACKFREKLGPARALRDVEAVRRLVELAVRRQADRDLEYGSDPWPADRITELRIIAARWSEHPDYNPSWSPGV